MPITTETAAAFFSTRPQGPRWDEFSADDRARYLVAAEELLRDTYGLDDSTAAKTLDTETVSTAGAAVRHDAAVYVLAFHLAMNGDRLADGNFLAPMMERAADGEQATIARSVEPWPAEVMRWMGRPMRLVR